MMTIKLTFADDTICLATRLGMCSIVWTRCSGSANAMCCRVRSPALYSCRARPYQQALHHDTTQYTLFWFAISLDVTQVT